MVPLQSQSCVKFMESECLTIVVSSATSVAMVDRRIHEAADGLRTVMVELFNTEKANARANCSHSCATTRLK
jgi:hypothetical protein